MTLQAYYDGSGKSDKGTQVLTLTGLASTEAVWREFKQQWEKALASNSVRSFHMTDLMAFRGEFARAQGWNEEKRHELVKGLFNVVASFRMQHFIAYSCSVLLDDYRRAHEEIPTLRIPEAICVNHCVGGLLLPPECAGERKPVVLYFDVNERFMHTINRVWLKKKRNSRGVFSQIRSIVPMDASHYPIQAADMIAWIVNRYHRGLDDWGGWRMMSTYIMVQHFVRLYNHESIVSDYPNG